MMPPPPSSRAYPGDLHLFFLLGGPFLNPGHTERDNATPPELLMDTNKPFVYKIDITILTSSPFSPVHTYTINWHFQKSLVWKAYSKISVESENREKKNVRFLKNYPARCGRGQSTLSALSNTIVSTEKWRISRRFVPHPFRGKIPLQALILHSGFAGPDFVPGATRGHGNR